MKRELRLLSDDEVEQNLQKVKDHNAKAFGDMELEVMELAQLLELAVEVAFMEGNEKQKFSGYGPVMNPLLKDLVRRAKKLVDRYGYTGRDDAAA